MQAGSLDPSVHRAYLATKYMPELDGLRAISILGVITAHMHSHIWGWLSGGRGVLLFFAISGYLITLLCLKEERENGAVHFGAFYTRRALRLLPAYYLVLGIYCLLIIDLNAFPAKRDLLVAALPYYLFYMSEIPGVLGINGVRYDLPFSHSWSLGIEEKFYLVFPVLMFGVLAVRRNLRVAVTTALMLLFMATPFFGLGAVAGLLHPYSTILAGCLIALLLHDPRIFAGLHRLGSRQWLFALTAAFLVIHFGFRENTQLNVWTSFMAVTRSVYTIVVALLLAAISLNHGPLKRALSWGPLVALGKVSYEVYLVHILCLNAVEKVVEAALGSSLTVDVLSYVLACALSVVVALILHSVVERPCMRLGQILSRRMIDPRRPALGTPACNLRASATDTLLDRSASTRIRSVEGG